MDFNLQRSPDSKDIYKKMMLFPVFMWGSYFLNSATDLSQSQRNNNITKIDYTKNCKEISVFQ